MVYLCSFPGVKRLGANLNTQLQLCRGWRAEWLVPSCVQLSRGQSNFTLFKRCHTVYAMLRYSILRILFDYELLCRSISKYNKKLKLSLSTLWKHTGGVEVIAPLILEFRTILKWLWASRPDGFTPEEIPPVAVCAVEPVWRFGEGEISYPVGNRTPERPVRSVVTITNRAAIWLRVHNDLLPRSLSAT